MIPRSSLRARHCSELARIDSAGNPPRLLGINLVTACPLTVPVCLVRLQDLATVSRQEVQAKGDRGNTEEKVSRN